MDPLTITALSASTFKILQQALTQWMSVDKKAKVQIKSPAGNYHINLDQASPELLNKIQELLSTHSRDTSNIIELSR